jgi:hypothetical protein
VTKPCLPVLAKPINVMVITQQFIEQCQSFKGGWSKRQLNLLGIEWPPAPGWRKFLTGKEIPPDVANQILLLKDAHLTGMKSNSKVKSDLPFNRATSDQQRRTMESFWTWLQRQPIEDRERMNEALLYIVRKNAQVIAKPDL